MDNHEKYIAFSKHFSELSTNFDLSAIGEKGVGLFTLDSQFVPPYFIIKSNLFKLWQSNNTEATKILQTILQKGTQLLESKQKLVFIIRSSAKFESFEERGFYES